MPRFRDSRVIAKPRDVLFGVVADVGAYPDFLPWCLGARITGAATNKGEASDPENAGQFDADLIVGYKMFRETFTSRVSYAAPRWIKADYRRGPLKRLHCMWRFDEIAQGTIVDFDVEFEFSNPTFDQFLAARFGDAVETMAGAFDARAAVLMAQAKT